MKRKLFRYVILMIMAMAFVVPCSARVEAKVIYTGNAKIDTAAEAIINRACSKKDKTAKQKLKACYNYLVKNMKYTHSKRKAKIRPTAAERKLYRETLKELKAKKGVVYSKRFRKDYQHLLSMSGTCKHMSGVMCILANHLGFKAGYCTGRYIRGNGTSCEHWWNWIRVNGQKRYCDVQAANCSWGRHHSQRTVNSYYLKAKNSKVWRKHHR